MLKKILPWINGTAQVNIDPKMRDYLTNTSPTNENPILDCDNRTAFKFFFKFISPFGIALLVGIFSLSFASSIDGYLIYQIKFIVDSHGGILDRDGLSSFALVLIVLMTFRAFLQFISTYLFNWSQNKLIVSVSEKVFNHIAKMPQAFFDIHGHGKIISKIQYEVNAMSGASGSVLFTLTREGSTVIAFLVVMFTTNWLLSSVVLVLLPVIYLTMRGVTSAIKAVTKNSMSTSEVQIRLLNEMVKGHQVVTLYNAQDFEHTRYKNQLESMRKLGEKGIIVTNLGHTFIQFIASLLLAALIYLAANAANLGIPPISAGDFIVIFTSMFGLLKPVRNVTNMYSNFIGSLVASKSIMGLLALDTETDSGKFDASTVDFFGDIVYQDVSFAYPTRREDPILDKFNLTIEAGKTYAFVGKSGGGKSTIVSLLPRTYDLLSGHISIGGVKITDISLHALRDNISVVSQNVHLFDDTIYNNIIYNDVGKYSEEEVLEAARIAHVLDFANGMTDGIHTVIGSDGTRLSGGQRQRVAIARALLRKKPILILDEATSALDNESEYFIQQSLQELQKGRTVLVIAHRLSTIESADKILVISDGEIVESGKHQDLIKNTDGEYYKLHTRDFSHQATEAITLPANITPEIIDEII